MSDASKRRHPVLGDVSASIIEILSSGMYESILDVIREYVQNSYDAIRSQYPTDYSKGSIQIRVDQKSETISILDNGAGMNQDELIDGVNIGYSRKGMDDVGFRGIGMMSGWAVADKIIVITKTANEDKIWQAIIQTKQIKKRLDNAETSKKDIEVRELFNKYITITQEDQPEIPPFPENHGTLVILESIRESHKNLLSRPKIIEYLSQVAPVDFWGSSLFKNRVKIVRAIKKDVKYYRTCSIEVNGTKVRKPYRTDESYGEVKYHLIESRSGEKQAFIWYQIRHKISRDRRVRGLRLRVKGFAVGDASYVQKNFVKLPEKLSLWVWGEMYVLSKDVRPTSDRNRLKDNEARSNLSYALRKFSKTLEKEVRGLSEHEKTKRDIEDLDEDIRQSIKRLKEDEGLTKTEGKQMLDDLKQKRKTVEVKRTTFKRKKDDETIASMKMDETISKCKKLEKKIIEKSQDDIDVLALIGAEKLVYKTLMKVINGFGFSKYCNFRKNRTLSELKTDLKVAIGEALRDMK